LVLASLPRNNLACVRDFSKGYRASPGNLCRHLRTPQHRSTEPCPVTSPPVNNPATLPPVFSVLQMARALVVVVLALCAATAQASWFDGPLGKRSTLPSPPSHQCMSIPASIQPGPKARPYAAACPQRVNLDCASLVHKLGTALAKLAALPNPGFPMYAGRRLKQAAWQASNSASATQSQSGATVQIAPGGALAQGTTSAQGQRAAPPPKAHGPRVGRSLVIEMQHCRCSP
jgi:hypothetical protein